MMASKILKVIFLEEVWKGVVAQAALRVRREPLCVRPRELMALVPVRLPRLWRGCVRSIILKLFVHKAEQSVPEGARLPEDVVIWIIGVDGPLYRIQVNVAFLKVSAEKLYHTRRSEPLKRHRQRVRHLIESWRRIAFLQKPTHEVLMTGDSDGSE